MPSAKSRVMISISPALCTALFALACGGAHATSPAAAEPSSLGSSLADGGVSATEPGVGSAPSNAPTTTTVTLADGGDVQGTKLESAQTSAASADVANAGPAKGAHPAEPGRSIKDIQAIVQSHRDAARACYDQAQSAHPDPTMKGNLDIKWTIDPTGKVTAISVDDAKSDIHDAGVAKCVMDVLRGVTFAVSAKGFETYAHYPFNFNPHSNKGARPSAH